MYQQLWGYKVEEKLYLGVREQKRLNTTDLKDLILSTAFTAGGLDRYHDSPGLKAPLTVLFAVEGSGYECDSRLSQLLLWLHFTRFCQNLSSYTGQMVAEMACEIVRVYKTGLILKLCLVRASQIVQVVMASNKGGV
jgi:hypothetical protein